ncbi:hypothetical protein Tco_0874205 [Tanacetum coccineum]|uniref:Uncharacterized protein n=1 Tax=Tanacetum coccineum TaxID=301880 RepID=A0ABQ5BMN3_9ASTR
MKRRKTTHNKKTLFIYYDKHEDASHEALLFKVAMLDSSPEFMEIGVIQLLLESIVAFWLMGMAHKVMPKTSKIHILGWNFVASIPLWAKKNPEIEDFSSCVYVSTVMSPGGGPSLASPWMMSWASLPIHNVE